MKAYPHKKGFTLFEVMLAVAVFSFAAIGLAICLNRTTEAVQTMRQEALCRRELDNQMATLLAQRLKLGENTLPPDDQGIVISEKIERTDERTDDKVVLPGLYHIHLQASIPRSANFPPLSKDLIWYQP